VDPPEYIMAARLRESVVRVRWAISFLMLFMICATNATLAHCQNNLLINGDLTKGSGNALDGWHTATWNNSPDFTVFTWHHTRDLPGEIEIASVKPNDAYWAQSIRLEPGWYHFTADIRTEEVGMNATGANLSILEDGIISPALNGTRGWTRIGFYLKVGQGAGDLVLACRLGGFASLNTGRLFCRNIEAVAIPEAPVGADHRYDLDLIRGGSNSVSTSPISAHGRVATWSMIAILLFAILIWVLNSAIALGKKAEVAASGVSAKRRSTGAPATGPLQRPAGDEARAGVAYAELNRLAAIAVALAVALVAWLAILRLEGTPYSNNFGAALVGLRSVLPATGVAALKLWSFWTLSAIVIGGLALQIDPALDFLDAVLIGASGVWVIAYLLGQLIGPLGLFRPMTIWLMLTAGIFQLSRKLPKLPPLTVSAGQKLTILACGLLTIGLLPLELGSPLAPYMDVLSYPASVQRILSFGLYLPFDNDPYGCWGPRAQTPALELFYAMLALGGGVKLGVLAHSGTMVPMAALLICATYRLGVTLANDTVGGVAALLLFFANIFRRLTGMRGTAVAFVLVALSLAFFLDRRRNRTLVTTGAIALGTAVAAHAIDGGLAMLAAASGVLVWLAEGDYRRFATGISCLFGASLIALPELVIGLGKPIPYPLMPLAQIAGIAVIILSAKNLNWGATRPEYRLPWLNGSLVLIFVAWILYSDAVAHNAMFVQIMRQLPLLALFGSAGLVVWITIDDASLRLPNGAALIATTLLFGAIGQCLGLFAGITGNEAFRSGIDDIGFKLGEYWCPYFLVFPAAVPFALLFDTSSRSRLISVLALLTILIYPWYPRFHVDYNFDEHSIAEEWGIDLGIAGGGFWSGTHDSRWTMGPADFALVRFLRHEQALGRVTTATHILHIAHDAAVMGDFNRFSVLTGINDDPILYDIPSTDIGWMATSRVRPISELSSALADHPAYILEQTNPPAWLKNPPDGYTEVFRQDMLRLFRRSAH
jgi:hypothetical protein